LDVTFAFIVTRMRFAGKDELDRTLFCQWTSFHDVFELRENQRCTFVGGEPAGKTDGQSVWINR